MSDKERYYVSGRSSSYRPGGFPDSYDDRYNGPRPPFRTSHGSASSADGYNAGYRESYDERERQFSGSGSRSRGSFGGRERSPGPVSRPRSPWDGRERDREWRDRERERDIRDRERDRERDRDRDRDRERDRARERDRDRDRDRDRERGYRPAPTDWSYPPRHRSPNREDRRIHDRNDRFSPSSSSGARYSPPPPRRSSRSSSIASYTSPPPPSIAPNQSAPAGSSYPRRRSSPRRIRSPPYPATAASSASSAGDRRGMRESYPPFRPRSRSPPPSRSRPRSRESSPRRDSPRRDSPLYSQPGGSVFQTGPRAFSSPSVHSTPVSQQQTPVHSPVIPAATSGGARGSLGSSEKLMPARTGSMSSPVVAGTPLPLGPRTYSMSTHTTPHLSHHASISGQSTPAQVASPLQTPGASAAGSPPVAPKAMINGATISRTNSYVSPMPSLSRRSTGGSGYPSQGKLLPSICPEIDKEILRLKKEYARIAEEDKANQGKKRQAISTWDRLTREAERDALKVKTAEAQLQALGY
ncbi:hypothetical protein BZA70DRAFT_147566 [Myxozyma melibiosi]|uniref:Uncharacterized protein n=1 Tax=Myxozyma melibiosi TaxID=54550 RepID=A0ABR1F7S6_9ASCO